MRRRSGGEGEFSPLPRRRKAWFVPLLCAFALPFLTRILACSLARQSARVCTFLRAYICARECTHAPRTFAYTHVRAYSLFVCRFDWFTSALRLATTNEQLSVRGTATITRRILYVPPAVLARVNGPSSLAERNVARATDDE